MAHRADLYDADIFSPPRRCSTIDFRGLSILNVDLERAWALREADPGSAGRQVRRHRHAVDGPGGRDELCSRSLPALDGRGRVGAARSTGWSPGGAMNG